MAKSLRSKSKRAFRRIKREDPKSDYHIRDKIRTQRLSEKLKELKSVSDSEGEEEEEDDEVAADGDTAMEPVDASAGAGASASGSGTAESAPVKSKAKKSSAKGKGKQGESATLAAAEDAEQLALAELCWLLGLVDPDSLSVANSADVSDHADCGLCYPTAAATTEDASLDATAAAAEGETSAPSKPVSTHGPRDSARLDWRAKRGLSAQRKRTDQNSTTFKHKVRSYKSAGRAGKKGKRS